MEANKLNSTSKVMTVRSGSRANDELNTMADLIQYFEQDDFDVDCFVERLARQTLAGEAPETGDDARLLKNVFSQTIEALAKEYEFQEERAKRSEEKCASAEREMHEQAAGILSHQKEARINYKQSRKQMDHIVAKTSYLGDILEAHHIPRSRLLDAKSIIDQFEAVLSGNMIQCHEDVATTSRSSEQIVSDHAQSILKLHLAASELLSNKYNDAKQKIAKEYSQVEGNLLNALSIAQRKGDVPKMKEIVTLMSNFRGYSACVDQFISNAQKKAFIHPDLFSDVLPLTTKVSRVVHQVFPYPEIVTGKFVDNVLRIRVRDYINAQLAREEVTPVTARQLYMTRMAQLYVKLTHLVEVLHDIPMDSATRNSLRHVPREIFQPYLRSYQALEYHSMRTRLDALISAYYQSVGHQKKTTTILPLQNFRRDIQSKISKSSKAGTLINVAPSVKDFGGETFICEALAVNILQELRESLQRFTVLLHDPERSALMLSMWRLFLLKFVKDHLSYGIDIGLKTIPVSQDLGQEPKHHFLRSVNQTNAIFHLIENVFAEEILPALPAVTDQRKAVQIKNEFQTPLEETIQIGLKRSVKAYAAWIGILMERQKLCEYFDHRATPTALKVVAFAQRCTQAFDKYLDGENKKHVLMEFGRRFHKVILNNIRRFHYSGEAGLSLLCDINEFRSVISQYEDVPLLKEAFSILQNLCGLLIMPAENLPSIIEQEPLNKVDLQTLKDFVQLRQDCKSNKLLTILFHDSSP